MNRKCSLCDATCIIKYYIDAMCPYETEIVGYFSIKRVKLKLFLFDLRNGAMTSAGWTNTKYNN